MAILTLKGMEHGTEPLPDPVKQPKAKAPKATSSADSSADAASETASTAAAAPAPADIDAQTADSDAVDADAAPEDDDLGLDSRAQIVKAATDEAAREVPAYLKSIKKESDSWQVASTAAETPEQQVADSNILMAWLRHLATDPFWERPGKDDKPPAQPADYDPDATTEPQTEQEQKAAAKAEQELDQQQLQEEVQGQQRDRGPAAGSVESTDPKDEGVERYMLSNPDYLHHIMEHDVFHCHEFSGTGERHTKYIPRYPNFEVCAEWLDTSTCKAWRSYQSFFIYRHAVAHPWADCLSSNSCTAPLSVPLTACRVPRFWQGSCHAINEAWQQYT